MKIDMWLIAERLEKYRPKCDIQNARATITGVRFLQGSRELAYEPQYVYLCVDDELNSVIDEDAEVVLVNGRDIIAVKSSNVNDVLNDLLAIFDSCNQWEAELWEKSASSTMQEVLDIGQRQLVNPMILADIDGNVLAMTSVHRAMGINEYWVESRNTNRIPVAVLGAPKRTEDDRITSWTDEPEIYYMPDGTKTIGQFLLSEGEPIGAIGLWEVDAPVTPGHRTLFKVLSEVLLSMSRRGIDGVPIRSDVSILTDLLSGKHIEEHLLNKLDMRCASPWMLVIVDNPFQSNTTYATSLVRRMEESPISCVPLIYERVVVSLLSYSDSNKLFDALFGSRCDQYYMIAHSLPFSDLAAVPLHYRHLIYVISQIDQTPGIYDAKAYALSYMFSKATGLGDAHPYIHPALHILQRYDDESNGELLRTLYYYLLYERSNHICSEKLHIHRNSFLYRIRRIVELTGIDLNDPKERYYLIVSFLIQGMI